MRQDSIWQRQREAPSPHKKVLQRKPQVQGSHLQTDSGYGFQMEKMAAMPAKRAAPRDHCTNQSGGMKKKKKKRRGEDAGQHADEQQATKLRRRGRGFPGREQSTWRTCGFGGRTPRREAGFFSTARTGNRLTLSVIGCISATLKRQPWNQRPKLRSMKGNNLRLAFSSENVAECQV